MSEIRLYLYAILDAEAQNAEEIRQFRQDQQKIAEDLKQIEKTQKEMLRYLQKNGKVKEQARPVYGVTS